MGKSRTSFSKKRNRVQENHPAPQPASLIKRLIEIEISREMNRSKGPLSVPCFCSFNKKNHWNVGFSNQKADG
jgi:hypothetical protein